MVDLLANILEFFTWCMGKVGSVFGIIIGNPILLIITVGFLVVGFTVGLASRFFRIN